MPTSGRNYTLSKRLGKGFLFTGKESLTVAGTLTLGGGRYSITIERRQLDEGENIAVSLNGAQPSLVWDDKDGARSSGNKASGIERILIERLALDSPEQFIFAQLRITKEG